jgi:hypothetical protein
MNKFIPAFPHIPYNMHKVYSTPQVDVNVLVLFELTTIKSSFNAPLLLNVELVYC